MNDVVIDTNVMVYCFDNKLDLRNLLDDFFQSGFSIFTIKKCMDELLSIKRPDVQRFFLAYAINVVEFNTNKNTDDTLLEFCLDKNYMLFTEDKDLRSKAKKLGVKTLGFDGRTVKMGKL